MEPINNADSENKEPNIKDIVNGYLTGKTPIVISHTFKFYQIANFWNKIFHKNRSEPDGLDTDTDN